MLPARLVFQIRPSPCRVSQCSWPDPGLPWLFYGILHAVETRTRSAPIFQAPEGVTAVSALSAQKSILACNHFQCLDQRIGCSLNGSRRGPRLTRENRKGDDERV
jgi:hypothetical protein